MKKVWSVVLVSALLLLIACGTGGNGAAVPGGNAGNGESGKHTIAVLVYDRSDDEVVSFRKYLQDYIGEIFDVDFLYSDTITSGEEALEFIREAAEYGAEGVMSFNSYDLSAEVALCEENKMYFMMASGTVSDKDFAAVEDSPYFVGVVGPGSFIEYKSGADMALHFVEEHQENDYYLLSGGGCLGNEMHKLRTEGILDTLQNSFGVKFDISSEEAALSPEILHLSAGDLSVTICPGYLSFDEFYEPAREEYESDPRNTVLSVLPATRLMDTIRGADLGVVDCYSETNQRLFNYGELDYLCGKYSSIVGPSFAAMYNAITGHEEEQRINGKAFHLTQGFWSSDSREDFNDKYVLANSIERNAYNYEDLQQVMMEFNPDAALKDLKELAEAYTFEKAMERRTR